MWNRTLSGRVAVAGCMACCLLVSWLEGRGLWGCPLGDDCADLSLRAAHIPQVSAVGPGGHGRAPGCMCCVHCRLGLQSRYVPPMVPHRALPTPCGKNLSPMGTVQAPQALLCPPRRVWGSTVPSARALPPCLSPQGFQICTSNLHAGARFWNPVEVDPAHSLAPDDC